MFVVEQKSELMKELVEVEKRKESLFIRQKILERNSAVNSRRNK